jgi:hypothetical protein
VSAPPRLLTLDIQENGSDVLNKSFVTGAAAAAYFSNNAPALGAGSYTGGPLDLKATLTVTTAGANSGFFGGLIVAG